MLEVKYGLIWEKVKDCLRGEMSEVSFKTWILPMIPVFADDSTFVLSVPDTFSYDYVVSFTPLIRNSFSQVCSRDYNLKIAVSESVEMSEILRSYTKNKTADTDRKSVV